MKLDYSLKTAEERTEYVREQLKKENPSPQYLKVITDYILFVSDKNQTKKERKTSFSIKTKNRETTINKRQVSYEAVADSLEDGEDGLFLLINNEGNQLLDIREKITKEDLAAIPLLQEHLNIISSLKEQMQKAEGRTKYCLKKQIIETYQQMYAIKTSFHGWPSKSRVSSQLKEMAHMSLDENITFDDNMMPHSDGIISLFNPIHVSFLLSYYQALKQESYEDIESDMRWFLIDFENIISKSMKDKPELYDILIWKIDGYTNADICRMYEATYGASHSEQYFSTVWRKKIPALVAEQAQKDYITWFYRSRGYALKKCGKCGRELPAHQLFFPKNSSKDSYYSFCRDCRKKVYKDKQK